MSEPLDIRHGDCLDVLPTLEAGSVDACVTDPPYGLEFMGKGWDGAVPGWEFWSAVLRVLKPGAYLLAFGGTRTFHRLAVAIEDGGFKVQDCLSWLYGQGFPKGKTQLKPAWEPILMAYKPGPRTLNVDECRIGTEERFNPPQVTHWTDDGFKCRATEGKTVSGRWPANVVLDREAAALLDEQSGESVSRRALMNAGPESAGWGMHSREPGVRGHDDAGGASRFFYTAKADSGERHYAGRNNHPTVKPVDLMRWLCRLVTPKGGLVLDPFMGSGSTGVAALAEGFRFLGIEREAEYVELARRRVAGPLFAGAAQAEARAVTQGAK